MPHRRCPVDAMAHWQSAHGTHTGRDMQNQNERAHLSTDYRTIYIYYRACNSYFHGADITGSPLVFQCPAGAPHGPKCKLYPPPEPPLALRCASEAAAAEAVAAIVAAQKDREDLLRSGCKATGAGLGT